MAYRPKEPFSTTLELLNPTNRTVKGVLVKSYEPVGYINCSFKTYGGTEMDINGVISVTDTAYIETWFRPDITSASQFKLGSKTYEVMGEPEDISLRHQYLKVKVRNVKGGA